MADIRAREQVRASPDLSVAKDEAETDVWAWGQFNASPDLNVYRWQNGVFVAAAAPPAGVFVLIVGGSPGGPLRIAGSGGLAA